MDHKTKPWNETKTSKPQNTTGLDDAVDQFPKLSTIVFEIHLRKGPLRRESLQSLYICGYAFLYTAKIEIGIETSWNCVILTTLLKVERFQKDTVLLIV